MNTRWMVAAAAIGMAVAGTQGIRPGASCREARRLRRPGAGPLRRSEGGRQGWMHPQPGADCEVAGEPGRELRVDSDPVRLHHAERTAHRRDEGRAQAPDHPDLPDQAGEQLDPDQPPRRPVLQRPDQRSVWRLCRDDGGQHLVLSQLSRRPAGPVQADDRLRRHGLRGGGRAQGDHQGRIDGRHA